MSFNQSRHVASEFTTIRQPQRQHWWRPDTASSSFRLVDPHCGQVGCFGECIIETPFSGLSSDDFDDLYDVSQFQKSARSFTSSTSSG